MTTGWPGTELRARLIPRTLNRINDLDWIIDQDDMAVSQKLDGRRLMIVRGDDAVIGISRSGGDADIPKHLEEAFTRVKPGWIFDGEILDGVYHVFDVLHMPDAPLISISWKERQSILSTVLNDFDPKVQVVHQVYGFLKEDFIEQLRESRAEGLVAVRMDGIYRYGVRSNNIGKYKFVKDVDCIITEMGRDGSDNLVLSLYDDTNSLREIGRVSALTGDGKHHEFSLGEVVQVEFLYVTQDLRLYQPVKPKLRLDKAPAECTMEQILPFVTSKDIVTPTSKD